MWLDNSNTRFFFNLRVFLRHIFFPLDRQVQSGTDFSKTSQPNSLPLKEIDFRLVVNATKATQFFSTCCFVCVGKIEWRSVAFTLPLPEKILFTIFLKTSSLAPIVFSYKNVKRCLSVWLCRVILPSLESSQIVVLFQTNADLKSQ